MGKRGPQTDGTAKRRILVPPRLFIHSDRELVQAQHFNEKIEDFLERIEEKGFPLTCLEPDIIGRVVEATEVLQHAVIDGIETYSVRMSPSAHAGVAEGEQFLRGQYDIGRKRGRLPKLPNS